jgi:hypothetical protein
LHDEQRAVESSSLQCISRFTAVARRCNGAERAIHCAMRDAKNGGRYA